MIQASYDLSTKRYERFVTILLFVLIYASHDTMFFGTNGSQLIQIIGYAIFAIVTVGLSIRAKIQRFSYWTLCLFFIITLTAVSNEIISFKYIYELLMIICAISFVKLVPFDLFRCTYVKIMIVLSVFSLIVTLLYKIAPQLIFSFPRITNVAGISSYFMFFSVVADFGIGYPYRNFGIFREPGVYMIFLNIALIFNLFGNEPHKFLKSLIFILAIIYTYSTGGYTILFVILLTYAIWMMIISQKKFSIWTLIIPIVVFIFIFQILGSDSFYNRVFFKFDNGAGSSEARFGSIERNIRLLQEMPIKSFFGRGYIDVENAFVGFSRETMLGGNHNTNTLFKMLSVHGVFYFIIICFGFFRFWKRYFPIYIWPLLLISFVMMLSNEDLIVNVLIYILLFYGLNQESNNKVIANG